MISGKRIQNQSKLRFPSSKTSNNSAIIVYEAHINAKLENSHNLVFKTMIVAELITLHIISDVERTPVLFIFAMSVENPEFASFLLKQNRGNFLYVESSTAWTVLNISLLFKTSRQFCL